MTQARTLSTAGLDLGPLARDLPFMVRNLGAMLRPEGAAIREALGIEYGTIGLLSVVWLNPGISQNDLAASLAMKKSAVTKQVKQLEQSGLLARERVTEDRRMNSLTLTSEGHRLVAKMRRLTDDLNARLMRDVPEEDRDAFFRVLWTVLATLEAQDAPPADDPDGA